MVLAAGLQRPERSGAGRDCPNSHLSSWLEILAGGLGDSESPNVEVLRAVRRAPQLTRR
jgi:hypothetical protein